MTAASRLLFRLARWIAGQERTEWVAAMAAETSETGGKSTGWAAGCLWASLKDRGAREHRYFLAVLFMPVAIYLLEALLFLPIVWLSRQLGLPIWTFIVFDIFLPFAFSFVVGKSTSLRRALIVAATSWFVFAALTVVVFWISFGRGPEIWFEKGSQIYNMPPLLGWACSLLVWLAGAWLGSLFRPSRGHG